MAKGMGLETCSMGMVISTGEPGEMVNIMVKENTDGKQRNQLYKINKTFYFTKTCCKNNLDD